MKESLLMFEEKNLICKEMVKHRMLLFQEKVSILIYNIPKISLFASQDPSAGSKYYTLREQCVPFCVNHCPKLNILFIIPFNSVYFV